MTGNGPARRARRSASAAALDPSLPEVRQCGAEQEPRIVRLDLGVRVLQQGVLAAGGEQHRPPVEEVGEKPGLPGRPGMPERFHGLALLRPPVCGTLVQRGGEAGTPAPDVGRKAGPEHLLGAVVPARGTLRDEQAGAVLEPVEHLRGVLAAGELDGQRRRNRLADADPAQQFLLVVGQIRQDLGRDVVGHDRFLAREAREEALGIALLEHALLEQTLRGQPQPGHPPVRADVQQLHLRPVEPQPGRLQEPVGLLGREAQLRCPQLAQPPFHPQPRDRQRRVTTGRENETQSAPWDTQERCQAGEGLRTAEMIRPVEHQTQRHR